MSSHDLPESHAQDASHALQDTFVLAMHPGLPHLVGALPQLQSYSEMGPTVYALTVSGACLNEVGSGVLVGPAVSAAGVTNDWPEAVQHAAKSLFANPPSGRGPGAVAVILIVQVDHESHCVIIDVPVTAGKRMRHCAAIPMSCAASALAFGY